MPGDPVDALGPLFEQGDALLREAQAAAQVPTGPGVDATGSVSVVLDAQGRVSGVRVATGWRRQLGAQGLAGAVIEAVRDASARRLTAWGNTHAEPRDGPPSTGERRAPGRTAVDPAVFDRDDFQRRVQAATTGPMSAEDRRAALTELLTLAEQVERGIDEVSDRLPGILNTAHTGHSPDRHVTVRMTGGGELTAVRLDPGWMAEAHEINIGRQITGAIRAGYEQVAAHGVDRLIADSALGEAQRATQDPLGLARRLRLTD